MSVVTTKKDVTVLLWLTSSLMITTVSCELITYNAALNRPAFQSSVHHNRYGYYTASLANDGNYGTTSTTGGKPQCAHSGRDTNPWWAVDLGRPTDVYRVDFTNVAGHYAYRSSNFIVGLTNVSPNVSRPTLWNYTLCGQYPGAVPSGATVSLYCQDNLPPFRYVIVQFSRTDHLNFCELQVLAVDNITDSDSITTLSQTRRPLQPNVTTNSQTVTIAELLTTPVTTQQPTGENVSCNPMIIALSVVAGVLLIAAVILVIVVIKQRTDNKQLNQEITTFKRHITGQGEDYATVAEPGTNGYQDLELSRR